MVLICWGMCVCVFVCSKLRVFGLYIHLEDLVLMKLRYISARCSQKKKICYFALSSYVACHTGPHNSDLLYFIVLTFYLKILLLTFFQIL